MMQKIFETIRKNISCWLAPTDQDKFLVFVHRKGEDPKVIGDVYGRGAYFSFSRLHEILTRIDGVPTVTVERVVLRTLKKAYVKYVYLKLALDGEVYFREKTRLKDLMNHREVDLKMTRGFPSRKIHLHVAKDDLVEYEKALKHSNRGNRHISYTDESES